MNKFNKVYKNWKRQITQIETFLASEPSLLQTEKDKKIFNNILSCKFLGAVGKKHQGGVSNNTNEADSKKFEVRGLYFAINSFPEFENGKDFEIKLSFSTLANDQAKETTNLLSNC